MERVALGKICKIYDGPHATPTKTESGPVYLGIDAITEDGKIDPAQYSYLSEADYRKWTKRVTPQSGDIIFSYEATLGRYAMIPDGFYGCLGRRLAIVRNISSKVNTRWLFYYFRSPEWEQLIQSKIIKGSTVNRISIEDFPSYTVPLLPLNVQDSIVDVLSRLDRKIELNNAINDNLQQMAKTIYDYWFTQFNFPNEDGKPYRSSGGQMMWSETAQRQIPIGWQTAKMETAIDGIRTGLNPRDNFKLSGGNIRYITVKNLRTDGVMDFAGCDTIDEEARQIVHRRSDVRIGDILFASIAPLGRCYLVQEEPKDWDINESVFSIRYNKTSLTAEYLYMHLQSEAFVKESTACSTGSIFKGIRINSLLDGKIIVPPLPIAEQFSAELRSLLSMQHRLNTETAALVSLRDFLLPLLMNGQATISD